MTLTDKCSNVLECIFYENTSVSVGSARRNLCKLCEMFINIHDVSYRQGASWLRSAQL